MLVIYFQIPDIESTVPIIELTNAFGGIARCIKRSKTEEPFFYVIMKKLRRILF